MNDASCFNANLFLSSSVTVLKSPTVHLLDQIFTSQATLLTKEETCRDLRGLLNSPRLSFLKSDSKKIILQNSRFNADSIPGLSQRPFSKLINELRAGCHSLSIRSFLLILIDIDRSDILHKFLRLAITQFKNSVIKSQISDLTVPPCVVENSAAFLTVDDESEGVEVEYDVTVVYNDEVDLDSQFAQHIIDRIRFVGLKVLDCHNDILPGVTQYSAISNIIESRCKKVMLILTPNFFHSEITSFIQDIVQFVSIYSKVSKNPKDREKNRCLILPVIFHHNNSINKNSQQKNSDNTAFSNEVVDHRNDSCLHLPPELQMLTKLHYNYNKKNANFLTPIPSFHSNISLVVDNNVEKTTNSLQLLSSSIISSTNDSNKNQSFRNEQKIIANHHLRNNFYYKLLVNTLGVSSDLMTEDLISFPIEFISSRGSSVVDSPSPVGVAITPSSSASTCATESRLKIISDCEETCEMTLAKAPPVPSHTLDDDMTSELHSHHETIKKKKKFKLKSIFNVQISPSRIKKSDRQLLKDFTC